MDKKESIIKKYFLAWLDNDPSCLEKIFHENIVYSECYGPEYHGLHQIRQWFNEWNQHGRVLAWDIKQFLHQGHKVAVEWYFRCIYDGITDGFDGVSIIEFNSDDEIIFLKEFQSKSEHEYPYGE
jgi:ketosteroid isomerase-like protein